MKTLFGLLGLLILCCAIPAVQAQVPVSLATGTAGTPAASLAALPQSASSQAAQPNQAAPVPDRLTLQEAEAIAVRNNPQISSAQYSALAAGQVVTETRSALFPTIGTSLTGADSAANSRIGAGGLNNSLVLGRYANGVSANQLITDFGRTSNLIESSRLHALSQGQNVVATKAQILVQVDQAYFAALRAQSLLKVAQETVTQRKLVADQITALANNKLKSGLDVSFANVNLAQAKLYLTQAESDVRAAFADLAIALGQRDQQSFAVGFTLIEEPMPPAPPADPAALVDQALRSRPELAGLEFDQESALAFAKAEKALRMPSVSATWSAGFIPVHVAGLTGSYNAAGINVSIPIFNGHLFSARRSEAEFRARAVSENVRELGNRITHDVRLAWLNAATAYQQLDLTNQLMAQATESLDLAQRRYDLGLSSIVELSQAQLNLTQAEIQSASAKYQYQIQRAVLDFQIGAIR